MKGSILVELALWLFFIVPGLIYSIWRHASVYQGCAKCGSNALIPLDSPVAQQIASMRTVPASASSGGFCCGCGKAVPDSSRYCPFCGIALPSAVS